MIKIYHNNRCKKSREALALLEESKKDFEIINYLKDTPTKSELEHILQLLSLSPLALIRKNEAVWKEHYKNKSLSDDDLIAAMVQHPKLIERPIVIVDDKAVIGRPPSLIKNII